MTDELTREREALAREREARATAYVQAIGQLRVAQAAAEADPDDLHVDRRLYSAEKKVERLVAEMRHWRDPFPKSESAAAPLHVAAPPSPPPSIQQVKPSEPVPAAARTPTEDELIDAIAARIAAA